MGRLVGSSLVTTRFQVTIPAEARRVLGLKSGQTVGFVFDEKNGRIELMLDV